MGLSNRACSVGFASVRNFGQALSHILAFAVVGVGASVHRQPFVPLHRATALCGCLYASLHNGFVWLSASILAWTWGGSPVNSAQQSQTGLRGEAPSRSRAAALTSPPSWGRGQGGWDIKSTHCNKLKPSFFRTYFCPYPAPLSRKPHTLDYTSKKIFNKTPLTY